LATRVANSFTYDCNGTSWNIHSFPIDSVTCARKVSH
uniref:Neur_chan_LBD domain-containing protein n=1 Tax=Heligmosomoides polygyrus TaxID=6339 RepID=A0A183G8Y7_HELPZ